MSNISFTSKITPVGLGTFYREVQRFGENKRVDVPWTIKESVYADSGYTTSIMDCTGCVIKDKLGKVLFMHICPTDGNNKNFTNIENYIERKIDLNDKETEALLIGSNNLIECSKNLFNNFLNLLTKKHNVPTTILRDGNNAFSDMVNIAYKGQSDEFLIAFYEFDRDIFLNRSPKEILEKTFKEVHIADCDTL